MRGAIIAAPLHMPASWIVRPASDKRAAGQFVNRVGGHHAAGGGDQRRFVAAQLPGEGRKPGAIFSIGKNSPMMPVDNHQRLLGLGPASRGREPGHFVGVVQSALAGAGVGIARVDRDGAKSAARRARAIERHRRGEDEVLRVNAGGHGGQIGNDQRQILARRVPLHPQCSPPNRNPSGTRIDMERFSAISYAIYGNAASERATRTAAWHSAVPRQAYSRSRGLVSVCITLTTTPSFPDSRTSN